MRDVFIEYQKIPADEQRNFIINILDTLDEACSLILINNCDPKFLINQLKNSRPYQFTSEYLAQGPYEWKVKLTKKMSFPLTVASNIIAKTN